MNIKETPQAIHAINKEKGFWDKPRNTGELLMLVNSELCEGLEADRNGRHCREWDKKLYLRLLEENEMPMQFIFENQIKDTFQDEIADAVIRLFDLAEGLGIDLEFHIKHKMAYNKTREHLHGKAY